MNNKVPLMSSQEIQAVMMAFEKEMMAKRNAPADPAAAANNKAAGDKFLAENKTKSGVKVTASGLQYKVLKQGNGPKPSLDSKVSVHYQGTLLDGTEFDSSYKRNQPASFPLQGVIKGWTEGLQLMPVGSKYMLYIPSELAYGPAGAGGIIGPESTLIFTIELLEIN
jgi:FKBP-type peptidyl-prolyl cis-trans isomerase